MNQVYSILQIEKGHRLNLKLIYLKFLDMTFFFHNTFKTPCLKGIFGEIWNMVIPAYSDIVCDLEYGERDFHCMPCSLWNLHHILLAGEMLISL